MSIPLADRAHSDMSKVPDACDMARKPISKQASPACIMTRYSQPALHVSSCSLSVITRKYEANDIASQKRRNVRTLRARTTNIIAGTKIFNMNPIDDCFLGY